MKIIKWQFYQINNFEVRKQNKNILETLFLYILNMINIKKLVLIATEIQSDETKSSGSIPAPPPVHSIARILKWPSFRILWSYFEKKIQGVQLDA